MNFIFIIDVIQKRLFVQRNIYHCVLEKNILLMLKSSLKYKRFSICFKAILKNTCDKQKTLVFIISYVIPNIYKGCFASYLHKVYFAPKLLLFK